MQKVSKNIQLQYEGFLNTPLLWKKDKIFSLSQFNPKSSKTLQFQTTKKLETRLGKRVEQFAMFSFQQQKNTTILAENIQIQNKTITVGELDCILIQNEKPIHIEIVYKFYLYDKSNGTTEIEHWIGPNRRDNLFKKLTKLVNQQFPLLYNKHTKTLLEVLEISPENFTQKVFFKAQLFIPLKSVNKKFPLINNKCIVGFYIHLNELDYLNHCKFFIPQKLDWLLAIQTQVNWQTYTSFKEKIMEFHLQKSAPLCWLKNAKGNTQKFFVVWW